MSEIDRILDASANRCREGLRVVEDYVRFVLNDGHLSRLVKELRHELAAALNMLPAERLIRSRDTPGDVGTRIETAAEGERTDPHHVARANAKRVAEALRSLEEYGKCLDAGFAARCEQLRYRFYTIEQVLSMIGSSWQRLADCRVYLLVGSPRGDGAGAGVERLVQAALEGGVDAVQLREKHVPDRRLIELARRIRMLTAHAGALFIINDRPDLAVLTEADGVHVGQDDLTVCEARRIVGGERLVGVSTHDLAQARQAVLDGADYLGVGPTFPSTTKSFDRVAGLEFVRQVAAEITLPWFAIGGITPENVAEVAGAGASRIAVSAAVCSAEDPSAAARSLQSALS